ncbi:polymeric immunoglobulin receptor-like isoform X3 [Hypanus sabinus]|uniref:polymeric immunoglobulin receptor-like isoform X3 n=1 Tax=Hypanus sabinus TaxID=79690 RepID=UPI0028C3E38B|nr:polymeric immunoglobulin receptor-like isoform X3 [Hypanus sabinus]
MLFAALLLISVISNSLAQVSKMVIRAGVGETVTMECPHAPEWRNIVWCKAYSSRHCTIIVGTVTHKADRRTSIKRQNGSVFVTMRELVENDSGIYSCGYLDFQHTVHDSDIVLLKVTTAGSWTADNTTVKGVMQTATSLHCHYEQQFKSYENFLCKVTSVNRCSVIASSEYSSRNLTIIVNNSTDFAVTIKQTNEGDKGEYWCGVTRTVYFEIVQIKILEIFEATIKTPEDSTDSKRNYELIIHEVWTPIRWILLGALFLCTVSIHYMTAFQRLLRSRTHNPDRSVLVQRLNMKCRRHLSTPQMQLNPLCASSKQLIAPASSIYCLL